MQNQEYDTWVYSDNNPPLLMGAYSADASGEKALKVYDIQVTSVGGSSFGNDVVVYMGLSNQSPLTAFMIFNDTSNGKVSFINYSVFQDTSNSTALYSVAVPNPVSGMNLQYLIPDAYKDKTLVATTAITYGGKTSVIGKLLQDITTFGQLPFRLLIGDSIDWILLCLLALLAISATIKSGNFVALIISAIAALFYAFSWFSDRINSNKAAMWIIISFAILISIVNLIKQRDKESDAE